ncbi:MAG: hypothetical protein IPJ03_06125 [Ignavibacteriales bacterium]|nr:hypothetical protein [Ignavibacteriales bacterium]
MSDLKKNLILKPDHLRGGFEWDVEPNCKCGNLKTAFDEDILFVSNTADDESYQCYVFLIDKQGDLHRSNGTPISYCPWCGEKIKVLKKQK